MKKNKSLIINLILIAATVIIIAALFIVAGNISKNILSEEITPDAETIARVKAEEEAREAAKPVQTAAQIEDAESIENAAQELATGTADENTNAEAESQSAAEENKEKAEAKFIKGTYPKQEDTYMYLDYYVYCPANVTDDMPLIVFLHGDGYIANLEALKSCGIVNRINEIYGEDFPFILLLPNTREASWGGWITGVVKELADDVAQEYNCDMEHIIVTGHSRGAIGTWSIVSDYGDYFSAAVPVSGATDITAESFTDVPVWGMVGECIDDYDTYYDWMKYQCEKVENAGGEAKLTVLTDASHVDTEYQAYTEEVFEWMLSQ